MPKINLEMNPFTREYHESEIAALNLKESVKYENIELKIVEEVSGRVDGYMYRDFIVGLENVPVLYINGRIWMSLTPMEIESHYMPIKLAKGRVGVAGLGLGYYVQRILDKEEVDEVIVYEIDQNIINFYYQNFGGHEKLTILKKDVRELKDEKFDFFYADIYPNQLADEAIPDMALLTKNNDIKVYHYWCLEHMLLEIMNEGYRDDLPFVWIDRYEMFLSDFMVEKSSMANIIGLGESLLEELYEHEII